jgi:hypothetical protein
MNLIGRDGRTDETEGQTHRQPCLSPLGTFACLPEVTKCATFFILKDLVASKAGYEAHIQNWSSREHALYLLSELSGNNWIFGLRILPPPGEFVQILFLPPPYARARPYGHGESHVGTLAVAKWQRICLSSSCPRCGRMPSSPPLVQYSSYASSARTIVWMSFQQWILVSSPIRPSAGNPESASHQHPTHP